MDLEVVIEGVSDVRLSNQIKRKIRQVCGDAARSGEWSVVMSPSETRGHWDLGLRGPIGRHFASFAERAGPLPELVAQHLRGFLCSSWCAIGDSPGVPARDTLSQ